jgi:hypothetical protein
MRPMFWVLAVAWVAVWVWGVIRGPRRVLHGICLGLVALLTIVRFGFHPLGGYESEALHVARLSMSVKYLLPQLHEILREQLPPAVFGEQLAPASVLGSILLLTAPLVWMWRRHMLWVLMVWITFGVTLLLSAEPRYYMTVLPILLLGWLLMTCAIARRLPRLWGELLLVASLMLVTLNNISASTHFVIEQRRTDFLSHYRKGEFIPLLEMCEQIRQHVKPDQKVLGPSGTILSVFTGRHVYIQREVFPYGSIYRAPRTVARMRFSYAVFPSTLYWDKEPIIARLMAKRIIMPGMRVATVSKKMFLAVPRVTVPNGDWRKLPKGWKPPKPVKAKKKPPATHPQSLRAKTTMLSPVFPAASGAVLSGVEVYFGSRWILDTACSMCGSGLSPPPTVIFFSPKYSCTSGESIPTAFSPWIARSRRLMDELLLL